MKTYLGIKFHDHLGMSEYLACDTSWTVKDARRYRDYGRSKGQQRVSVVHVTIREVPKPKRVKR